MLRERSDVQWLAISLVLSIALTVALNLVVRLFPRATERTASYVAARARRHGGAEPRDQNSMRLVVPWKAMLIASLLLTLALNVALWWR